MPTKLQIEIALEGAEEIKSQLAGIGKAGEDAFAEIAKAANQAGGFSKIDPAKITASLKQFGVTGADAVNKINKAVETGQNFESMARNIGLVEIAVGRLGGGARAVVSAFGRGGIAGIVGGVALATVAANVMATAKALSEVDAQAIKLGSSVEDFSKLRNGLSQMGVGSKEASAGLTTLQGVIDKLKIERVDKAFKEAKENIKAGWAPAADKIKILETAANDVGAAAERAREHLQELGRPFKDTVTPRFESMVRWAGSVEKALPLITDELARMGNAGEKARLAEMALKGFAAESGNAIAAAPRIIDFLSKMPDGLARSSMAIQLFGQEMGTGLVQAMRAGGDSLENFKKAMGSVTQSEADAANRMNISMTRIKAAFQTLLEIKPGGGTLTVLDMITRAVEGLSQSIARGTFWQDFAQAAETALGNIGAWIGTLAGRLGSNLWQGFVSSARAAGQAVLSFLANLPGTIVGFFVQLGSNLWQGFVSAASAAGQAVLAFLAALPGQIAGFFVGLGQGLWEGFVSAASAAGQAVLSFFVNLPGTIAGYFLSLGESVWDGLVQGAQAAAAKIKGFFSGIGAGGGGAIPDAGGFARGGFVGGRGSGTSDSNLAWLSRGEHIMPAYAVRQPGVLALLEALRRSGGNLRSVLDRMGHFAMGGLVLPAYADGGIVGGGMSHVTIAFPGLPPVGGLRAPRSVVEELHRAAAMAQVRSGGRKPSRYS